MRKPGVLQAHSQILIPFFDVDAMNVVWHGHYVKYLEIARCVLLEKIGHGYRQMCESGYAWPVIDLQLRYIRPLYFGQIITVCADLVEWESRLKIHYLLVDEASGARLSRASTVQVAVDRRSGEMQFNSPPVFIEAVQRALQ